MPKTHGEKLFLIFGMLAAIASLPNENAIAQNGLPEAPAAATSAQLSVRAGFAVAGPNWPIPELQGVMDPAKLQTIREQTGYDDARIAHKAGARMLRLPFSSSEILGDEFKAPFAHKKPIYQMSTDERLKQLDGIVQVMNQTLKMLPEGKNHLGKPLKWNVWDYYIRGVERFNAEIPNPDERIRILLLFTDFSPRPIIEAPSAHTLQRSGRKYTSLQVWQLYMVVNSQLLREAVKRYVTESEKHRGVAGPPTLSAFEIINEPDYHWIPDEARIERSLNPDAYPGGKYITELHHGQIPLNQMMNKAVEKGPWSYQDQDMDWWGKPEPSTPVGIFNWGRKFNKYVLCCAQLMETLSKAVKEEGQKGGVELDVVSGAVTHNNVDYLRRLYQANPRVFEHVNKIGLHPYHWPAHDIWRDDFVSDKRKDDWEKVNPREFAKNYFKRFDFLEEIAKYTAMTDLAKSFGMAGKKIWVTEFGVPTKKLGKANKGLESLPLFIFERGEDIPPVVKSIIWEDKWDKFFAQVNREYLARNNVEAFFIYTLREGLYGESSDDEHSNFAVFHRNGEARMEKSTHEKLLDFFASLNASPAPSTGG
jgi:hypothetical protein